MLDIKTKLKDLADAHTTKHTSSMFSAKDVATKEIDKINTEILTEFRRLTAENESLKEENSDLSESIKNLMNEPPTFIE